MSIESKPPIFGHNWTKYRPMFKILLQTHSTRQEETQNRTITYDSTTPETCRYTTLRNLFYSRRRLTVDILTNISLERLHLEIVLTAFW